MRKNAIILKSVFVGFFLIIQAAGLIYLDPIDRYDSNEYLAISGSLYRGTGYSVTDVVFQDFESFFGEAPSRMRQPAYPVYLLITYWLTTKNIHAVQVSQIILNSITLLLTFIIAKNVFGHRLWMGTLAGLALYFPLWLTSAFILSESLFILLFILSFFLLQRAFVSDSPVIYYLGTGAILGLAFLTRPIALPVLLLIFIPMWFHSGFHTAIRRWGIVFAIFTLVILPWFVRNSLSLSDFTPLSSDGGYNLWYASRPTEAPQWFDSQEFRTIVGSGYYLDRKANQGFTESALLRAKTEKAAYVKRGLLRMFWVWSYFPGSRNYNDRILIFGFFTIIQVLILVTAFLGLTRLGKSTAAYFLAPVIGLTCVLMFTKGISRFIVPAMPFVLMLSGQGLHSVLLKIHPGFEGHGLLDIREEVFQTGTVISPESSASKYLRV